MTILLSQRPTWAQISSSTISRTLWRLAIVTIFFHTSDGNSHPKPAIDFHKGFIDDQNWLPPFAGTYYKGQKYTMDIYMKTFEGYDFVIDQCTYNNTPMIGAYGCSSDPSKYIAQEYYMSRNNVNVKRVLVQFHGELAPLTAICCTVRVLQCHGCANKVCKCQPDLRSYNSWQCEISQNSTNGDCKRSNCVDSCACDVCDPESPLPTPTTSTTPTTTPTTTTTTTPTQTTTTTTMRSCSPPCVMPCYGCGPSPCLSSNCGGVVPIAPLVNDVTSICGSCAPLAFGCAWRCMRCEGCPAGVYYPWYALAPWWIWLLLALIPLLLLLCCCLPWFFYLLSKTPFFRRKEKPPPAAPNAVVSHCYDKAPQRIVCANKDVQTNANNGEPRTAAIRYGSDHFAGNTESQGRVEKAERLTSRENEFKELSATGQRSSNYAAGQRGNSHTNDCSRPVRNFGVQNVTNAASEENIRVTTRVRVQPDALLQKQQPSYNDKADRLELGNQANVSLRDAPPPEASGGIYLKKDRAPLARPEYFGVTNARTRQPIPYNGRWESYESEEIKESVIDENRRIIDDGSTQFGVNQRNVPINFANDGRNNYENYRPSIAPPPYPSNASSHLRHNRTVSVPRPTTVNYAPLGASSYDPETENATTRPPRSRSAERDFRYDTSVSPTYVNNINGGGTPSQIVFSSDSYPTSSEEMYREEVIRTTRQSSAL